MDGPENALIGFAIFLIIGFICFCIQDNKKQNGTAGYHYEYVDMEGNAGIAHSCSKSSAMLTCRNGSEVIQVTSYNKVDEE